MQNIYPENSIPTPPFSPGPHPDEDGGPLESTISLVDSLVAFYQQERMWVCRTRARFETRLAEQSVLSPPENYSDGAALDQSSNPDDGSPKSKTPWTKRKRDFKLRLDGLGVRAKSPRIISTQGGPGDIPSRGDILSMYEKMMDSRMESCQRVGKLVRNANRAGLHNR